jgi:hypothetical protein
MLSIEHLRIRLPPGFEHRAADIARLVGQRLGELAGSGLRSAESVSVPKVRLAPGATNAQVAENIARAISTSLRRPK